MQPGRTLRITFLPKPWLPKQPPQIYDFHMSKSIFFKIPIFANRGFKFTVPWLPTAQSLGSNSVIVTSRIRFKSGLLKNFLFLIPGRAALGR